MSQHLEHLLRQVLQGLEANNALIQHVHRDIIDLSSTTENIMTAISDFTTKMTAFFDRQDAAVAALQGDVKNLEDQISALQNSSGAISPADQTLLDGIQARAATVADKLDALDALTPPVVPPSS